MHALLQDLEHLMWSAQLRSGQKCFFSLVLRAVKKGSTIKAIDRSDVTLITKNLPTEN